MSRTFFALSCLAASAAAGTLAFSAPAAARTVTVAVSASFTSLDPYDAPDILTRLASKSFYEGLFTFNSKMEPVPELAEGYETSPDAKVWTVTLKKGVKFHDGSEFTADAVKANFDRLLNPDNKLSRYNVYKFIEKVEVLDPYKVRFTLQAPLATFVRRLAMTNPQMICPSLLKDAHGLEGKKVTAFNACGTGPYTLVSFNPAEELVVKKNPNYRDPSLPKLDGIVWKPVVENSTRAAMLHTGEAQFVFPMPNEQIAQFKGDPKFRIEEVPSIMQRYLSINTTVKPFDDVRVRQAINYAINKEALCKVAFAGYAVPSATIYPAEIPGALKLAPGPMIRRRLANCLRKQDIRTASRLKFGLDTPTVLRRKSFSSCSSSLRRSASRRQHVCLSRAFARRSYMALRIRRKQNPAFITLAGPTDQWIRIGCFARCSIRGRRLRNL